MKANTYKILAVVLFCVVPLIDTPGKVVMPCYLIGLLFSIFMLFDPTSYSSLGQAWPMWVLWVAVVLMFTPNVLDKPKRNKFFTLAGCSILTIFMVRSVIALYFSFWFWLGAIPFFVCILLAVRHTFQKAAS